MIGVGTSLIVPFAGSLGKSRRAPCAY
jgi:hypothetical protein